MLASRLVLALNMGEVGVRVLLLLAVVLLATAFGLVQRRRAGRARVVAGGERLTPADLFAGDPAAPLGERATFVQFSSPACTPCRAVHRILDAVVADRPDLQHLDIDATTRLDLAARLGILRTPTVLVLDSGGVVVRRISGPLTADQARAAVLHLPDPIRS